VISSSRWLMASPDPSNRRRISLIQGNSEPSGFYPGIAFMTQLLALPTSVKFQLRLHPPGTSSASREGLRYRRPLALLACVLDEEHWVAADREQPKETRSRWRFQP
jgi:hypothetical protein